MYTVYRRMTFYSWLQLATIATLCCCLSSDIQAFGLDSGSALALPYVYIIPCFWTIFNRLSKNFLWNVFEWHLQIIQNWRSWTVITGIIYVVFTSSTIYIIPLNSVFVKGVSAKKIRYWVVFVGLHKMLKDNCAECMIGIALNYPGHHYRNHHYPGHHYRNKQNMYIWCTLNEQYC